MTLLLSSKKVRVVETPINVSDVSAWFYEEKGGLYICVRFLDNGYKQIHLQISWKSLVASVRRYIKSKGKTPT